jgi:hypothetical protein
MTSTRQDTAPCREDDFEGTEPTTCDYAARITNAHCDPAAIVPCKGHGLTSNKL